MWIYFSYQLPPIFRIGIWINKTFVAVVILLYKAVRFLCLKLKISLTTEPIGLSALGKFHIGPVMVLDYFNFRFKSWDGLKLFFMSLNAGAEAPGKNNKAEKSKY